MANLPVLLRFTRSSRGASAAPRARYCSRPRVRVVAPADMRAPPLGKGDCASYVPSAVSGCPLGLRLAPTTLGGVGQQLVMGARAPPRPHCCS